MKTWEKGMLLRSAGKYIERKFKRTIAVFAAVSMVLSIIPMAAFADGEAGGTAIADHSTHSGCKAISMGETYIAIDGVEQESNRLSDGSYYLAEDITASLILNGNASLCLNGFSINSEFSRGIEFYTRGKSLTVDDCKGTGGINSKSHAIYSAHPNSSVTINGGTVGSDSCSYGISLDYYSTLHINGGSVIGRIYGISNTDSDNSVYLSGAPVVSGGRAGISNGTVYADNGAGAPVPYSGETVILSDYHGNFHHHGDVMVSHVTEGNKNLFALHSDFSMFSLVYDGDFNTLKLEGEAREATWYAEDGSTVLSGEDYPSAMHYGEVINPMPVYEKEGYVFAGWYYRDVGDDEWSRRYYDSDRDCLCNSMEFKADIISKNLFEGDGTANSPYLIQSADDLVALAQVTNDGYEYYNAETVYYQLTAKLSALK